MTAPAADVRPMLHRRPLSDTAGVHAHWQVDADLTAAQGPARHLLLDIHYAGAHGRDGSDPRRVQIGLEPLATTGCRETWWLASPTESGWHGDIGWVRGGDVLVAHLLLPERDPGRLEDLAREGYTRLLAFLQQSDCAHLLRVWNFMPGINDCSDGLERYQRFCVGRAAAFAAAYLPERQFPAATAIGSSAPGLWIHVLAARRPGIAVENPRQISAYRYPLEYGPRPPSFARAMCIGGPAGTTLALSGTASVVGHHSMHPDNLLLQTRETLRNLRSVVDAASGAGAGAERPAGKRCPQTPELLRVYLRSGRELDRVDAALRARVGESAKLLYLRGAICRNALLIEIDGHCRLPPRLQAVGRGDR